MAGLGASSRSVFRRCRLLAAAAVTSASVGGMVAGGAPTMVAAQAAACGTVVAGGLNSPRFVAVADDGTVYVSEGGTGGAEVLPSGPEEQAGPPGTRGLTGQVTRVAPNGAKSVLAGNLPSYFNPIEGAVGPAGLALSGGALWLAIGSSGEGYTHLPPLPNEASVVRISLPGGAITKVADLGAYEAANNPGGFAIDTNPYGLARAADGTIYAADAGGNTLYRIAPSGQLSVAAVLPGLPLPPGAPAPPGGNPSRGGANEIDPVPTGVAVGPDGSVYLGLLSGFPFPPGAAKVVRLGVGGATTDVARGLTMVTGVAVGPDRTLYVSEISTGVSLSAQGLQIAPGRVERVLPNGSTQVVADGLMAPNGIAFDRLGNLYVVVNSAFTPPDAGAAGQVVRCDRVAAPATGLPRTGSAAPGAPSPRLPLVLAWPALAIAAAASVGARYAVRRR